MPSDTSLRAAVIGCGGRGRSHAEGYAVPLDWVEELEEFSADETRQIMSSNLVALLQAP